MGQLIIPLACRTMFSFENARWNKAFEKLHVPSSFTQIQNEKTSVHGPPPICLVNDIDCGKSKFESYRYLWNLLIFLRVATKIYIFFFFGVLDKIEVFFEFWKFSDVCDRWYKWIFFEIFRIKNWKRKGRRISTITVYKLEHLINFLKKGKIILLF